ncbi:hypothetical protein SY83_03970 [Paenibacillus swuensis]|uniref:HTH gntR-type domain-containing protein n=1 Tax=Paenibacillus swuensis TaxID=1178515 RepID=A0A172TNT0_9BACL|nr:hypothetical protein SY83_03970 [Paenibacillus swuensis]
MIDLSISFDAKDPLYIQLYQQIRELVHVGALKGGMKLPSIRSLQRQLNISKTTVETAYHMLLEEGYVVSKERSGLVVVSPPGSFSVDGSDLIGNRVLNESSTSFNQFPKQHLIDFSLLSVDGDSFPIRIWKSVVGEALSQQSQFIHLYGDPQGEMSFRESLSQYLRKSRGVVCSPEQIVIGTGISYSILLLSKLLKEIRRVGVEKSGIAQVRDYFIQHGFEIVLVDLNDLERVEQESKHSRIHMLYVTPSHQPSGDPMPYLTRQRILEWASRHETYIIEDDYDGELRLSGKPVPSLQGLDKSGSVIYIGTFSKTFSPALRLNYMVLPINMLEKLKSITPVLSGPSRIDQWAMQLFMSRGHWYRHLRRVRKIYRYKNETLVQLLRQHLPGSFELKASSSGLHIELLMTVDCDEETLIGLAKQEGVLVYGSQGGTNQVYPKIYLGFGGLSLQEMEEGVQLLCKAWSSVLKGR